MNRTLLQQAFDALKHHRQSTTFQFQETNAAIKALEAELAKPDHPNPAAQHWHNLYRAKCKDFQDQQARLGAEIAALEEELTELKEEQLEQEPEQEPAAKEQTVLMGVGGW
jgi:chromosome segregation ATPase